MNLFLLQEKLYIPLSWKVILGFTLIVIGVVIVNAFLHSEMTE